MKKTSLVALAVAATLTGATLSAASADTTPAPTISPAPSVSPLTPPKEQSPAQILSSVLASLVKAGTINQSQADAITAAVKAAIPTPMPKPSISGAPKGDDNDGNKGNPKGGKGSSIMSDLKVMLGIPAELDALILKTLNAAPYNLNLANNGALVAAAKGKSLAQLASVDKAAALIAALVTYENAQIDKVATAKNLSADNVTKLKSKVTDIVTKFVNIVPRAPKGKGKGDDNRMPPVPAVSPSPSSSPSA